VDLPRVVEDRPFEQYVDEPNFEQETAAEAGFAIPIDAETDRATTMAKYVFFITPH
jgi:hypothetical protein